MAAMRILACVAAASALQAPAQTRRPATKLQALGVVEGLGALAVGGGLAVLLAEDNRDIDDKTEVERYFNGEEGFGRWNKIYSESDDVNGVQQEIRDGHAQTIDKVLSWAEADGRTVCDLGCGVGSLAIPLAQKGATVSASDISNAMATEASKRAAAAGITTATFETSDMENVNGEYDTVSCIDVMIHYPTDKMVGLVDKLCALSKDKIYVSFAPKTPQLAVLKKVGSLFPGPSKATRAYLHKEEDVVAALAKNGFKVDRSHLTSQNFYFSLLLEATATATQAFARRVCSVTKFAGRAEKRPHCEKLSWTRQDIVTSRTWIRRFGYGGYCAYAVSKGKLVTVDPDVYVVLDEKLFLFSNAEARTAFENEEPGIVQVADGKWAELESERAQKKGCFSCF
ncbi:unnamed protein product [Pelagomonas calceolata]|uniref:Methyltransferase domain-containing protein n=2 Tax=Pelagomonas calceolata TaxID=35677 RepID=A0A8J2SDZ6_9STRA|nr:unnamed protein product [Pelagomonas calceolata]